MEKFPLNARERKQFVGIKQTIIFIVIIYSFTALLNMILVPMVEEKGCGVKVRITHTKKKLCHHWKLDTNDVNNVNVFFSFRNFFVSRRAKATWTMSHSILQIYLLDVLYLVRHSLSHIVIKLSLILYAVGCCCCYFCIWYRRLPSHLCYRLHLIQVNGVFFYSIFGPVLINIFVWL